MRSEAPVEIGLSAKASFEAKVATEIPSQSSGRFIDAVTDIFRPFSERRGLKADQIRLQREDVLIQIARKARERMQIENQNMSPLPNKFLVPFLEKASLEELDSPLIDRWVDLLTSSSIAPERAHPRFVQILSELTGIDAQLLRKIALNGGGKRPSHCVGGFTECDFDFKPEVILEKITEAISHRRAYQNLNRETDKIYEMLLKMFESRGVSLRDIILFSKETTDGWSFSVHGMDTKSVPAFVPEFRESVPILVSLDLLRQVDLYVPHNRFSIQIDYVYMTELGIEFMTRCDRDVDG